MKRRHIVLFLLGSLVCLAIILQVKKEFLEASKRCMTIGNISAVTDVLRTELNEGNPNLEEIFSSADEQWRFLTPEEYDRVITQLAKYDLDPATIWNPPQPLLDPWGSRSEIAYRKLRGRLYDVIVVSKGPDRVYGTKDDVFRYGPRLPEKLDE